ncbi:MAG: aldehyde dehydrogenase family protein, partial [Phycisphaerae bacterium]
EAKLGAARRALEHWSRLPLNDRSAHVTEGLRRFRENGEQIARDITAQMGKPITQARREVATMFERAERSIADAPHALAPDRFDDLPGFVRRIEHAPLGIVLDIAAWNYPLLIPVNVIVPALLAGNVVLLKHSAKTPRAGEAFEAAFGALEVLHLVTNLILTHEQTARVIGDRRIEHVAFTGSVEGGYEVYKAVSNRIIDVGLELGGKDPAYVAADADLETTVENVVDGACYNAGQSCCAVERVYVHQQLYNAFVEKAEQVLREYRLGDPMNEQTTMGPLASRSALDTLERQVQDAVERGATVVCGGQRVPDSAGNFFPPTLVTDVPNGALIMQEESFGPLVPVTRVRDDEEAIRLMNDTRFGLTASIWTIDPERAERLAARLNAGTVYQNRCDYLDPALPWAGWGESGKGSTLSRYGFYHLTRRKSIHFRTG